MNVWRVCFLLRHTPDLVPTRSSLMCNACFYQVFGRTLRFRTGKDNICWLPHGKASNVGKSVRQHRLKRGLAGLRKTFTTATTKRYNTYVAKYLPKMVEHTQIDEALDPEMREGEREG